MNKEYRNIGVAAAILVGCGVAIGAMAHKIYKDKNKEYIEAAKHLKNETDFKLSKEFLKELKEELKEEQNAKVVVVKVKEPAATEKLSKVFEQTQETPVNPIEGVQDKAEDVAQTEDVSIKIEVIEETN